MASETQSKRQNKLLADVHAGIPCNAADAVCSGHYLYFHYLCDGIDDRGWGCGYRTLQSISSWVSQYQYSSEHCDEDSGSVPDILSIQKALVEMMDKPQAFVGSKQWIGSFEVCLCLDFFYKVPCKIVHVSRGSEMTDILPELQKHFQVVGAPIMMGGETDNSSKGIMGVRMIPPALLVVDPHFCGENITPHMLQQTGYVKWMPVEELHADSFYNLCLPKPPTR